MACIHLALAVRDEFLCPLFFIYFRCLSRIKDTHLGFCNMSDLINDGIWWVCGTEQLWCTCLMVELCEKRVYFLHHFTGSWTTCYIRSRKINCNLRIGWQLVKKITITLLTYVLVMFDEHHNTCILSLVGSKCPLFWSL